MLYEILLPFEVPLGYLRTTAIVPSKYYIGTFEIPLQYLKSTARVLSKYRTGTLQVPLSTVPVLLLTFFWCVLYICCHVLYIDDDICILTVIFIYCIVYTYRILQLWYVYRHRTLYIATAICISAPYYFMYCNCDITALYILQLRYVYRHRTLYIATATAKKLQRVQIANKDDTRPSLRARGCGFGTCGFVRLESTGIGALQLYISQLHYIKCGADIHIAVAIYKVRCRYTYHSCNI